MARLEPCSELEGRGRGLNSPLTEYLGPFVRPVHHENVYLRGQIANEKRSELDSLSNDCQRLPIVPVLRQYLSEPRIPHLTAAPRFPVRVVIDDIDI